jgi:hypothetical protein
MAGPDFSATKIDAARKAGYSDAEIVDFMKANDSGQTQKALDAGYSPKEIVLHVAGDDASRGYGDAVVHGVSDVVRGVGKTLKDYGLAPDAGKAVEAAGDNAAALTPNYESATDRFLHPKAGDTTVAGLGVGSAPRAVVENAPGIATDLTGVMLGQKLGGALGPLGRLAGGAIGGIGSYVLRSAGSRAEADAAKRTGDANATPASEDLTRAALTTGAEGAVGQIGLGRIINPGPVTAAGVRGAAQALKKLAGTAATEGAVGGAQNVVGQVGDTIATPGGVSVDPREAAGAAALGAGTGVAFGGPRAVRDTVNSGRLAGFGGDGDPAARTAATRIVQRAGSVDALNDPKAALSAVRDAHAEVNNELSTASSALEAELKGSGGLSPDASNAILHAQKGHSLTDADLAAIDSAGQGTQNGSAVSALAREAQTFTKLKGMGDYDESTGRFAGGITNALGKEIRLYKSPLAYGTGALLSAAGLSGDAATLMNYSPHAAAALAGVYGGARLADKALGLRSPAHTFAERFYDPSTQLRPTAPAAPAAPAAPQRPTGPLVPPAPTPWGAPPPQQTSPSAPPGFGPLLMAYVQQANRQTRQQASAAKAAAGQAQAQRVLQAQALVARLAAQNKPAPVAPAASTDAQQIASAAKVATPLMRSLQRMADLKQKTIGAQSADAVASSSPLILDNGGLPQLATRRSVSARRSSSRRRTRTRSSPQPRRPLRTRKARRPSRCRRLRPPSSRRKRCRRRTGTRCLTCRSSSSVRSRLQAQNRPSRPRRRRPRSSRRRPTTRTTASRTQRTSSRIATRRP